MNDWNYDIDSCPLDTKVRLLSADNCFLLPQMEFVGTLTDNGRFITRGKCYEGDPDYFYRSAIVEWKPYEESVVGRKMTREEARALELTCEKLLFDATGENCSVSMALSGHLRIQFGENNMTISKHDLFTVEWMNYNGDFTVLLDEIDVIQKTIQENNKLFKRLMWSYEHIRELGE